MKRALREGQPVPIKSSNRSKKRSTVTSIGDGGISCQNSLRVSSQPFNLLAPVQGSYS
jgi:hypothetical protein